MPCGILVPRSEPKLRSLAVEACSPQHWKAKEFLISLSFFLSLITIIFSSHPFSRKFYGTFLDITIL